MIQPGINADPTHIHGNDSGFITMAMRRLVPDNILVEKVKSHVEKRKMTKSLYTMEEYGNVLADWAAGEADENNDINLRDDFKKIKAKLTKEFKQIHVITCDASEIIQQLMPDNIWNLYAPEMLPVPTEALEIHADRSDHIKYLTNRTEKSKLIDRNREWTNMDTELAAFIWDMKGRKRLLGGSINRILYDLHWHGGNRSKGTNMPEGVRAALRKCNLCGRPDSQDHILNHCTNPIMKIIRAEGKMKILKHLTEGSRQFRTHTVFTELASIWQSDNITPEMWIGRWKLSDTKKMVKLIQESHSQCMASELRTIIKEAYAPIIVTVHMLYNMRGAMMAGYHPKGRLNGIAPLEDMFIHLTLPNPPPLIVTDNIRYDVHNSGDASTEQSTSNSVYSKITKADSSTVSSKLRTIQIHKSPKKARKPSYSMEAKRTLHNVWICPGSRRTVSQSQLRTYIQTGNTKELNIYAQQAKLDGWESCKIHDTQTLRGLELIAKVDLVLNADNDPCAWRYEGETEEIAVNQHIENISTHALVYGWEYVL
jgi:hypothetical protein